jgi:hypothetical protein
MDHLYIRHAVGGRLFYDSKRSGATYEMAVTADGCTVFSLHGIEQAAAAAILDHCEELNLFLVPEGQTERKSWFYPSGGQVTYDADQGLLRIYADIRHDYTV